jgi:hypothetical protein
MAKRIQLSRARGWRLPPGASSVAYPTRYANPFRPKSRSRAANREAVAAYAAWLLSRPDVLDAARRHLAGRDLASWCPLDLPCHADVLLAVLNDAPRAGSLAGAQDDDIDRQQPTETSCAPVSSNELPVGGS